MNKKVIISLFLITIVILSGFIIVSTLILFQDTANEYYVIDVADKSKYYNGTTLYADLSDTDQPRIVEVNMDGKVVWEYTLPDNLKSYINPGLDVELLDNNNILFVAPLKGVFEVNRSGDIQWSYLDSKVSHDADRLLNGNTLIIWGGNDTKDDMQVKEVNSTGSIVWNWSAKNHYDYGIYENISDQGWTHANAATRLQDGNTLINLRNFNLTVEVNNSGDIVREFNWTELGDDPHEPEIHDETLLIGLQWSAPNQAVEINLTTEEVIWEYNRTNLSFTRDADRLPNDNTLIVGVVGNSPKIFEVTRSGEIVWQLAVRGKTLTQQSPGWFYKAQRIRY